MQDSNKELIEKFGKGRDEILRSFKPLKCLKYTKNLNKPSPQTNKKGKKC